MVESTGNDTSPPAPDRVARRGLLLYALASRGEFDQDADPSRAESYRSHILRWIVELDLEGELEPHEKSSLHADIGSLEDQKRNRLTWLYEAAAVLAWSLGRLELPPVDRQVAPTAVGDVFFENLDPNGPLILRPASEIEAYEAMMYNLHWRVRDFHIRRRPHDTRSMLDDTPEIRGIAPLRFVQRDIAVDNLPLHLAPPDRAAECFTIVETRRHAASWLCGHHKLYSQVPLDT
jgi:Domain of unknown function (DUF4272)